MTGRDQIDYASLTDVGVRRSHNQDSHAVLMASDEAQLRKGGHVFLVADGMGAHAVGELASELAASIIPHTYHKYAEEGAAPALQKAFQEANASIHARGQQNKEFQGMGTTSTALVLREDGAWVGHVGDSRAYRIRRGRIEQLSFDHSLAWELARRQGVQPDGLEGIPSNVIVRSLGPEAQVQVDVEGPHPVEDGDIYVLCSDGLSNPVSDQEIGAVATVLPPNEACQFLIHLANLRGGPDNITAVVVRVGGKQAPEPANPGPGDPAPKPPPPWWAAVFHLMPWPFYFLVVGVLLAGEAAYLTVTGEKGIGLTVFWLAAGAIFIGLAGLGVNHLIEERKKPPSADRQTLNIYRQALCGIDAAMVSKLVQAESALEQWAREKALEVDWVTHELHRKLAQGCLAQNDLSGAFREFCRAMWPLTEALQRQRRKEEVFQPVWDKVRNRGGAAPADKP